MNRCVAHVPFSCKFPVVGDMHCVRLQASDINEEHTRKKEFLRRVASIAQWLEHWSRKPGVVSSILTGGSRLAETAILDIGDMFTHTSPGKDTIYNP